MDASDAFDEINNTKNRIMTKTATKTKTLHIAPMLHVTNAEFRNFFRILTKKAVLWTEMVVDETIVYNSQDKNLLESYLGRNPVEQSVICQIGGISPTVTAQATPIIEDFGYDEINLNMDCPSDRVSGRKFGALLMKEIDNAVDILTSMKQNVRDIPVSVKCRVGIDEFDTMDFLVEIITKLSRVCDRFYIHARKCILAGLTPEQNRLVPPLNYPRVYALCDRFPDCQFWINGGIPGLKVAKQIMYGTIIINNNNNSNDNDNDNGDGDNDENHNDHQVPCALCKAPNGSCTAPPLATPPNLRGCMLGRAAMDNPAQFWDVDRYLYGCLENPCRNRREALEKYCQYLDRTYPRRCCDSDDRITSRIPAPNVVLELERPHCHICSEFFSEINSHHHPEAKEMTLQSKLTLKLALNDGAPSSETKKKEKVVQIKAKITSRVIDRSLKPVLGMFFGLPGSKNFRRACDVNSRDMTMRNCGPAFVLRKAMQAMPPETLDRDFVRTDNLRDSDVTVHVSPSSCSACLG